jgi:hypothetical protein
MNSEKIVSGNEEFYMNGTFVPEDTEVYARQETLIFVEMKST